MPAGGIEELEDLVVELEDWFNAQQFDAGKPLDRLTNSGAKPGVILNVIIDSYEPLYCALTTLFLNIPEVNATSDQAADVVEELLRLHPPFRYINRMPPDNQPKVSIDLFDVNRDAEKFENPDEFQIKSSNRHLSFGFGKHACPGAKPSTVFLSAVAQYLLSKKQEDDWIVHSGAMTNNGGFCKAENFNVSLSKCPFHNKP